MNKTIKYGLKIFLEFSREYFKAPNRNNCIHRKYNQQGIQAGLNSLNRQSFATAIYVIS